MLLIYQIKVGLCLIAFYLLWKLMLSRETFHRFNRVALLTVMALALVLPWVKISMATSSPLTQPIVVLEDLLITPDGAVKQQAASWSWSPMYIATVIYFLGVAVGLLWLLHSQWNLYRMMRKGHAQSLSSAVTVHVLPDDISPFSYFKHIVISEQDYRDNPNEILVHEQAHIRLHHSVDVVFIGLLTLFQWWNPAAWLLGRELRQVHEYEADEAVLQEGIDARQYQLLLIKKSVGNLLFSMANNFNYQSLKKRIRMMTINKSSRWKLLRALAVVPAIALALLAFANPEVSTAVSAASANSNNDNGKIYKSVEQMPQFPGGEVALMKYLMENVSYPAEAAKNKIQGRVVVQFVVEADGHIGEVKVARSVDKELDEEAVRVIKSLPDFTPGYQDGKPVAVWYTVPVSFMIREDKNQTPATPQDQ